MMIDDQVFRQNNEVFVRLKDRLKDRLKAGVGQVNLTKNILYTPAYLDSKYGRLELYQLQYKFQNNYYCMNSVTNNHNCNNMKKVRFNQFINNSRNAHMDGLYQ